MSQRSHFIRTVLVFIICLYFGSAPTCWAWESFPEFESVTETEPFQFRGPGELGSEYQSDMMAYQKSEHWDARFLAAFVAFDSTFGSTSTNRFLDDSRLKFRRALTDGLEFRFILFSERDQERDSQHQIFELIWWPLERWGLSFYGQPSYHKRENDLGFAAIWAPGDGEEHRAFLTFVDWTRNERNDRIDRFESPHDPAAMGLAGQSVFVGREGRLNFWKYAVRHEKYTKWIFPQEQASFEYLKSFVSFYGYDSWNVDWDYSFRFQWDSKWDALHPLSGSSTVIEDSWNMDRQLFHFRVFRILSFRQHPDSVAGNRSLLASNGVVPITDRQSPKADGRSGWTADFSDSHEYLMAGVELARRDWKTPTGTARYLDVLPHAGYKTRVAERPDYLVFVNVGYDIQIHHEKFEERFLSVSPRDGVFEHRLNLTWSTEFKNHAALDLLFSFDPDFLTTHAWQGGNGRFRMDF